MTTYDYTGVVELVGETKSFGANGFTKRDLVVGNDVDSMNKYPNPVLFTFEGPLRVVRHGEEGRPR